MEHLLAKQPNKLSSVTLFRAAQIAEKFGHPAVAQWLKGQVPDGIQDQVPDAEDVKLLLASSHDPSGYRPLGDAPERFNWKPLTDEELNQRVSPEEYAGWTLEDPFKNQDISVVEGEINQSSFKEIHRSQADLFVRFYNCLKMDRAPTKIKGDDAFREGILELVRKMLTRPSGRWALVQACRLPFSLAILKNVPGHTEEHQYDDTTHAIFFKLSGEGEQFTKGKAGELIRTPHADDSILLHEIVHAIHHGVDSPLLAEESRKMIPSDERYTNLEEQRTIAGVEEECDQFEAFALSENVYNFEQGYPKRYSHAAYS